MHCKSRKDGLAMSEQMQQKKMALVPRLRFPEFREAGPWEVHELSEYLTESRVEGSAGDVARKITVKLWGNGVFAKNESIKGSENTRYYRRSAGQFIYSKLDFLNQAFGVIPEELDGYESTVDLPCFDIASGLDSIFLLEYVKREDFYRKNGEIADGGRKAKRIQTEVFLSFPIALPPQEVEQRRIADCLSSLDELIAAESQKLNALKTYQQGLMQQLLPRDGESVPLLRFPEFSQDEVWADEPLEDLAKRGSGHTPSKAHPEYYDGGIKWVSLADSKRLDAGLITETEVEISAAGLANSSAVMHPAGSVLLSRDAGVGKSAVMGEPMAVSQHFIVWACKPDRLCNWFLYYTLQQKKSLFEKIATGSTIKTIGLPFFTSLLIKVPSLAEQERIAGFLFSLDSLIAAQRGKVEALKTHKLSLMQQLFPVMDETNT